MQQVFSNFVLIGMPGAGKSTAGVILAKRASLGFVDTDVLIQTSQGQTLQEVVDTKGHEALRRIEEEVILALSVRHHVIATGGSAVYSSRAMSHLRSDGLIIYLEVDLPALKRRVPDYSRRGIAKRPDQSFSDLFAERTALYEKYADLTVPCAGLSQEAVCDKILEAAEGRTGFSFPRPDSG